MEAKPAVPEERSEPAPERLPLLRHLQAVAPEVLDDQCVVRICGPDRDVILRLIRWNEDETTRLRLARRNAQENEDEAAETLADTELWLADAMAALLMQALQAVPNCQRSDRHARTDRGSSSSEA
ncbi:MAG: hypothetical protein EXQ71_02210 [Acidimicrobiia bacterium]|nr:hypothetical protein [Acidimicrobiia bacterium]